jgi:hypothetical protein
MGPVRRPHFFECYPDNLPMIRYLSLSSLLFAATANAAAIEPYLRFDSFSHSEPVAIHSFITRWQGLLDSGHDAVTHNWFEAGVCYGVLCVASLQRLDYEVKANRDTAQFYYLTRNHLDLPVGVPFNLDLRAYEARSRGLRLAYKPKPSDGLSLEFGLSILDAVELINGSLSGQATVNGPKDYDFSAQVGYTYSKDALFSRETPRPDGSGFSLDVTALWQINKQFSAQAQLRDLYGYLDWKQAPFTIATATSANKTFDTDGYVTYHPTLSGIEGNADYHQRLHPHALLGADWKWTPSNTLGIRARLTEVNNYLSVVASHSFTDWFAVNGELMPSPRALGFGFTCGPITASLLSDDLLIDQAHILQLNVSAAYQF